MFGTHVEVTVAGLPEEQAEHVVRSVLADLDQLHVKLHPWRQDGALFKVNQAIAAGRPATVDAELAGLIRDGARFESWSDGLFAPGIGKLVALWGFHADSFAPVTPDPAEVARLAASRPSLADLTIDGDRLTSRNRELSLDFGGYTKGLALDRARRELLAAGVRSVLVDIGGDVIALGKQPDGTPWKVAIQHPRKSEAMAVLALADGEAVATSGDYQRYFSDRGGRHCHLVDPRDGSTDCKLQAVTVLMPAGPEAGARADVAGKPIYFAGPAGAGRYAARFGTPYVLLIDADGTAWVSPAFDKRLEWLAAAPKQRRTLAMQLS
ncbi:FAD:protein FMN transferase [Crenobacter sp. SG2303]|uniref:FAD:protein FMN transferase n=1 Tax=Crenobacter oryzisoli TaxID=3056844 RepID=A0ABT7XPR7_9NEIS|nr:FAD:protein FMN transferase [Crenobacter sp. SG2303]MDN0075760.1 FAD:protein FMN transferase [Crenobacter sp. SG2303]